VLVAIDVRERVFKGAGRGRGWRGKSPAPDRKAPVLSGAAEPSTFQLGSP
jgi:hypothetical protein